MATRITATAAAIGLAGAALALQPAQPARAARADAGALSAAPGGSIPYSVADPATAPRPVVTVTIGGVSLLLLLDTGSTGIRVIGGKVPAGAVAVTGKAAAYGYGSGVQLHGDQADADVAIGAYHTGPIPIELVRSTDCFTDKPKCPAANGAKPTMFGGLLDGVMGVSLEGAAGLVNPMWTLQNAAGDHVGRQFAVQFAPDQYSGSILLDVPAAGYGLVQLPKTPVLKVKKGNASPEAGDARTASARWASYYGSGAYDARALDPVIGGQPSKNALAAFPARPALPGLPARPALPAADPAPAAAPPSWNPRAVQTCLVGDGLPKACEPAMFDSGTPNFLLDVPGAQAGTWRAGKALQVSVPQVGWNATFTSGPGNAVSVSTAQSTETGGSLLGLPAFAKGPLRFDLLAGTVGFPVPGANAGASAPVAQVLPSTRSVAEGAPAPAAAAPPAAPSVPPSVALPAGQPAAHGAPKHPASNQANHTNHTNHTNQQKHQKPEQPFHKTAKKAPRLPDTGVPMSAALGAVTALTALLAGIGTVLAARRRTDREA